MLASLLKYVQHLKTVFLGLPRPQKILYAGGLGALVASIVLMVYLFNRPDYTPLFTNLSQSDMGEVVQSLKTKKVPYQLSNGTVDVPRENVYDTRIALAAEGIPKGSGVGFEIFDQQKLGSTEFVQKINYQRAIQGELARTINGMDEVLESRVHVVMPEESLFQEDRKPPSAAVVLKLQPGRKLDPKQVRGIVHLVSSTVRGLDEDRISVMSTDGQVLFKKNQEDQAHGNMAQLERQSFLEDELRQKVQTMLEQLVGMNKVMTRVSVDLDFNQVQMAEETFDPDSSVIRSQQRSVENSEGKDLAARGNPDVPINVEGKLLQGGQQGDGKGKQFNRQRETVNYEINKVSKQIVQAPGTLKRVSVAVILDGPYEMKDGGSGKQKLTFVGRSPAELKAIEDVVKKAVGYTEARGDQITVSNFPFAAEKPEGQATIWENKWLNLLRTNQRILINVVLAALIFLFLVRPLLKRIKKFGLEMASRSETPLAALPGGEQAAMATAGAGAAGLMTEAGPERKLSLKRSVMQLVQRDPNRATELIRALLREEA